jgi:D-alanyl-D-alanine carboxypeptidase
METMTTFDARARRPDSAPPPPASGRLHATTIVTALYVALVLGAPAIVRFAPDAGAPWVTAVAAQPAHVQCASVDPRPCACGAINGGEGRIAARGR